MKLFISAVDDILGNLGMQPDMSPCDMADQKLEHVKQQIVEYVAEHDDLETNSPILSQISNSTDIEQIEILLRHNLNYCEECLMKMYRSIVLK